MVCPQAFGRIWYSIQGSGPSIEPPGDVGKRHAVLHPVVDREFDAFRWLEPKLHERRCRHPSTRLLEIRTEDEKMTGGLEEL